MPPPPREDPIPPLKQQLAREIVALTDGWSQWNAASLLELDQPRMSNLRRAKLDCFSLDRLVRLLWRLDRRLEVTLVDTGRRRELLRRQRDAR